MLLLVDGEEVIYELLVLLQWCMNQLKGVVILEFQGHSLTLWNFLIFFFSLSIVTDLFAIWAGGGIDDDVDPEEVYYDMWEE